jgi:2-dehydro-3-deoxyphosphogluconate aldolase/(4S)-4-hydroxy-2-oxoglutarate aldolase
LEPLFEAILPSGLETVEITMNTPGAAGLIQNAVKRYGKSLMIGAGTVLNMEDLRNALKAGATFIVSPVLVPSVVRYCVRHKIPVFPGALTPQEIHRAWEAGATMVKVFPASCLGPSYFREIKGPFQEIELLACSGVTPENMGDYLRSGASAIAVGSSVFRRDWVAAKRFSLIRRRLQAYLKVFSSGKGNPT